MQSFYKMIINHNSYYEMAMVTAQRSFFVFVWNKNHNKITEENTSLSFNVFRSSTYYWDLCDNTIIITPNGWASFNYWKIMFENDPTSDGNAIFLYRIFTFFLPSLTSNRTCICRRVVKTRTADIKTNTCWLFENEILLCTK